MKTWVTRRAVADGTLFLLLLGVDRWTKLIALSSLASGASVPVGSLFGIHLFWTLTYNQGAAWGTLGAYPTALLLFRLCFIALLMVFYVRLRATVSKRILLVILLAGACGNIIDTVVYGHVVDMIHVQLWGWNYPVFNIADMSICFGAFLLALSAFPQEE